MKVKTFEVRDRGTFIPVMGILMVPTTNWPAGTKEQETESEGVEEAERYLLRRAGYAFDHPFVVLCRMECSGVDRNATYDPFSWGASDRTFHVAHTYIVDNWEKLKSGDVIDVEFILGDTFEPKKSERIQ